jgi:hypothetical protein
LIVERQDDALPPYTRLGTKQNLERPALQLVGDLDLVTADRAREALSVTRETRQERRGRRLEIANCPPIMPQWLFTRDPGMPDGADHELAHQQQRNLDEHRVMAFLRQPGGDGAASPWRHREVGDGSMCVGT